MITKILILSRAAISYWISEKNKLPKKWALISIYCTESPIVNIFTIPRLNEMNCFKTLSLRFADIKPSEYDLYILKNKNHALKDSDVFGIDHANTILNFIKNLDEEEILIIHCAAGISRSGAVGLFCCRYFGLDQEEFYQINKGICPNSHVIDVLNQCSGINTEYLSFWEDMFLKNDRMRNI